MRCSSHTQLSNLCTTGHRLTQPTSLDKERVTLLNVIIIITSEQSGQVSLLQVEVRPTLNLSSVRQSHSTFPILCFLRGVSECTSLASPHFPHVWLRQTSSSLRLPGFRATWCETQSKLFKIQPTSFLSLGPSFEEHTRHFLIAVPKLSPQPRQVGLESMICDARTISCHFATEVQKVRGRAAGSGRQL
jgi:hypothetical protein